MFGQKILSVEIQVQINYILHFANINSFAVLKRCVCLLQYMMVSMSTSLRKLVRKVRLSLYMSAVLNIFTRILQCSETK